MKLLKLQKSLKFFTDLKFAILVLTILAIASSLGSFIEQDESVSFINKIMHKRHLWFY
jgi:cytochrome c biogenesis protein ResB